MPSPTLRSSRQRRAGRPSREVTALVERAVAGDERAWQELVAEFENLVWAVARSHRLSDADAAEVSQTTWTHLVEHLARLHDPARVGAWLATTARRESLRVLRHGARVMPSGDVTHDQPADTPAHGAALIAEERDAVLWQAFASLRERDQALLRMLVADPRPSYEAIGAALDMPIGSIGPTSARALTRLRHAVEALGLSADALTD